MNIYNDILCCRVCGLKQPEPPWGIKGDAPTFLICSCCGTEFGYQDCTLKAILENRQLWLNAGAPWSDKKDKPNSWCLEDQLKNISEKYRK